MGRRRRRPSSCSVEDEGWTSPVILLPLVQRDRRRLERRVVSLPSPQQWSGQLSFHLVFLWSYVNHGDNKKGRRFISEAMLVKKM
jgi:hypothetical protein